VTAYPLDHANQTLLSLPHEPVRSAKVLVNKMRLEDPARR
jgi:hypothetical protein